MNLESNAERLHIWAVDSKVLHCKKGYRFSVLSRDVTNLFYSAAEDAEGSETGVNMIQLADFLQLYNSRIFTQKNFAHFFLNSRRFCMSTFHLLKLNSKLARPVPEFIDPVSGNMSKTLVFNDWKRGLRLFSWQLGVSIWAQDCIRSKKRPRER